MSSHARPGPRAPSAAAFVRIALAATAILIWRPAHRLEAADVVISEFMADNRSVLQDEDGDSSDWIELQNVSSAPVSLAGWFLTDDAARPTLWRFPERILAPGGFLVVFASGKNRSPASPGQLHASFRLGSSGGYLALVRPDGQTLESGFFPTYPPQRSNLSYGTPSTTPAVNLLAGATVSIRIPSGPDDLDPGWETGSGSPGAPWIPTSGFPIGFDSTPATTSGAANLALGGIASQSTTGYGLGPANGNDGSLATFTHTATNDDGSTWTLDLRGVHEIRRVVLHNRPECCHSRFRDLTATLLASDGNAVLWRSDVLNRENTLRGPASITLDLLELDVDPIPARYLRVSRTPDPDLSGSGGVGNADEDSVLSLGEVEVYGVESLSYAPFLRTDITDLLSRKGTSLLTRVPFVVASPDELASIQLHLRYDDGVRVYLNGHLVRSRNAPADAAWNGRSVVERTKAEALEPDLLDLAPFRDRLSRGTNWLAFQSFNAAPEDTDFLLDAELIARPVGGVTVAYLERPTPGASNNVPGFIGLVADTRFGTRRGFHRTAFDLAITSDTPGAEIRYTLDGSVPSSQRGRIYSAPLRLSKTTVVRAAAFKPGYLPTNVDSHTFLFPEYSVAQPANPEGFPPTWAGLAADYAMDPRIAKSPAYAPRMVEALRSLPTLSLACDVDDLFGPSRGIYANPERNGASWERPVSLEWIEPDGRRDFHAGAGLRVQGGYFRNRSATHKHSLRLLFKDQYGPGRLRSDLFETFGAARDFDTLVLRAGANDGYAWDAARDTEQFTRDEFGRRLHLAMGQTSPHGRFVHLYLNGLYWGLYNLTERPAEDFSASYFGGDPADWDAVNSGEVKNGSLTAWNALIAQVRRATTLADYQALKGLRSDGSTDPALPTYLDSSNYIDYMLLNIWGGNWDWPNKNFWFGRDRTGASGGFKFYLWDFENTLGNNRDRSPLEMVSPRAGIAGAWVAEPHDRLRRLDEYRMEFADRVHRHCFGEGVLAPATLIARYRSLAGEIESAIVAETARWGDDHHSTPQDLADWQRERDWLLASYLPRRTGIVLDQFRAAGLYPSLDAPSLDPAGPSVSPRTPVSLRTRDADELVYTTNGLDPRLPGGAVRPGASRVSLARADSFDVTPTGTSGGAGPIQVSGPLYFDRPVVVMARARRGNDWSALETRPYRPDSIPPNPGSLVVSQFCPRPPEPVTPPEIAVSRDRDEFEYVEFLNVGVTTLDLAGVRIAGGIAFDFPSGTLLDPGRRTVVVRNRAAFVARYGPEIPVAGTYEGRLSNEGDSIVVRSANGKALVSFSYGPRAPWPTLQDFGFALVLVQPQNLPDPAEPLSWRASSLPGGSPGRSDSIRFQGIADTDTDTDGNGQPDLFDHAFGAPVSGPGRTLDVRLLNVPDPTGSPNALAISLPRRTAADDVVLVFERAPAIGGPWQPAPAIIVSETPLQDGLVRQTYTVGEPTSGVFARFVRIGLRRR